MRASRFVLVAVAIGMVVTSVRAPVSRGVEPVGAADEFPASSKSAQKITPACRKSIDRGTQWLMSAQRRDGALGADLDGPADLGCTAITGLALLAQGHTTGAGTRQRELVQILNYVLGAVDRLSDDGELGRRFTLVRRKIGNHADLFLSAVFLSQTLGECPGYEKDVRAALEKLVAIICRAQQNDGKWGEESWAPVLGTVLGWESLRASNSCGLKVEASAKLAGEALFKQLQSRSASNGDWMQDFYKNASSIRVLYSLNYRDDPVFRQCVERILQVGRTDDRPFVQAGGEEYLAFFLVTECLLQEKIESWQAWYPIVRDKIMRTQNQDGSWTGHHCIKDRTFCTAAALLTLQAPNLYLPISNL